jgi:hypothetical protein
MDTRVAGGDMLDAICELTLEARDIAALERFN